MVYVGIKTMVHISDGNSERGAHVWSDFGYLLWFVAFVWIERGQRSEGKEIIK